MGSRLRQRGFTLVELLVIVAILALLMSLLMPTLRQARVLTIRTVCCNRVRAILTGSFNYASQNRDFFPYRKNPVQPHMMWNSSTDPAQSYDLHETFFKKYVPIDISRTIVSGGTTYEVNDADSVMFCPGPLKQVRGPEVSGWNSYSGYAYRYSTYQYLNMYRPGAITILGDPMPDLRHQNAPARYALWTCLTVDKGGGWFLAHDVPYRRQNPSGQSAGFLSGAVAWTEWGDCEPYFRDSGNQDYYWPIPR